jgi:hypothetical protein
MRIILRLVIAIAGIYFMTVVFQTGLVALGLSTNALEKAIRTTQHRAELLRRIHLVAKAIVISAEFENGAEQTPKCGAPRG